MAWEEEILGLFPDFLRDLWKKTAGRGDILQEIRLRAGQPVILLLENNECFLAADGCITYEINRAYRISSRDMEAILNHICRYSLYAFEDELKQGFMTVPGGHRVGVAGQVVVNEDGSIRSMKHISYMNIRISHEIPGIADTVIPFLYENGQFLNGMIISPPGCGKTTMLRDIVRQVSNGNIYGKGRCVGVVDERSEIAGCYLGKAQNDVGIRTDILDACPKASGMMMLIRSMAPRVVAVDEIGCMEDVRALRQILQCGSNVIVTIHGEGIREVRQKNFMEDILEQKVFRRYIVLTKEDHRCVVKGIYNQDYGLCLS